MPKVYIDAEGVTFAGKDAKVGDVVEVSETGAKALFAEGKARPVDADGNPTDVKETPAADPKNPEANPEEAAAAEVAKQKEALASQYNLEEGGANGKPGLKEAAQAAGVDFAFNATKAEIIDAVVAQGKAAELIK